MNIPSPTTWYEANSHYLITAITSVTRILEHHLETLKNSQQLDTSTPPDNSAPPDDSAALAELASAMSSPPALERLCAIFDLSSFERQILLLGAGMAIFSYFPALCANAQGDAHKAYPTLGLATQVFPQVHWDAFLPAAPLRYWHLLQIDNSQELTLGRLQIDESILHYLMGESYQDPQLNHLIPAVSVHPEREILLPPSQQRIVEQLEAILSKAWELPTFPIVQLCGSEVTDKWAIALASTGKRPLKILSAHQLPIDNEERQHLMRRWEREFILTNGILLLAGEKTNASNAAQELAISQFIQQVKAPLIITTTERLHSPHRPLLTFEIPKLTHAEQKALWQTILSSASPEVAGFVDSLVSQFNLNTVAIQTVSFELQTQPTATTQAPPSPLPKQLWNICRTTARPHLENLAQRIETKATWEDLVLPAEQHQVLQDIAVHIRHRAQVYQTWGFAVKSSRGLGISALFSGISGTGKTMAAEVLAQELQLDLYRIDLSAVVSKYIGETEKNMRQIFDAAEMGGAILLFDEADALFGKRTEVKDSHDRFANIEVSYLLQRMEAYQGLAILTTNLKDAIDDAFLRRIRFFITFPFPDPTARALIWQSIFPKQTPTQGLDINKLARLKIAGGNIYNIALNAAFNAADAGEPVMMKHILAAVKTEYIKLEKTLHENDIKDWV